MSICMIIGTSFKFESNYYYYLKIFFNFDCYLILELKINQVR